MGTPTTSTGHAGERQQAPTDVGGPVAEGAFEHSSVHHLARLGGRVGERISHGPGEPPLNGRGRGVTSALHDGRPGPARGRRGDHRRGHLRLALHPNHRSRGGRRATRSQSWSSPEPSIELGLAAGSDVLDGGGLVAALLDRRPHVEVLHLRRPPAGTGPACRPRRSSSRPGRPGRRARPARSACRRRRGRDRQDHPGGAARQGLELVHARDGAALAVDVAPHDLAVGARDRRRRTRAVGVGPVVARRERPPEQGDAARPPPARRPPSRQARAGCGPVPSASGRGGRGPKVVVRPAPASPSAAARPMVAGPGTRMSPAGTVARSARAISSAAAKRRAGSRSMACSTTRASGSGMPGDVLEAIVHAGVGGPRHRQRHRAGVGRPPVSAW